MRPDDHCFREDNCREHPDHEGPTCCCCGALPEAHSGCDCDPPGLLHTRFAETVRSALAAMLDEGLIEAAP